MSHWQLDQKEDARKWYNQAGEWMGRNRSANLRTSAGPVLAGAAIRLKTTGVDKTVLGDTDIL